MNVVTAINDLIWNPMAYLALGLGLFFTVLTRGIQFRGIHDTIARARTEGLIDDADQT